MKLSSTLASTGAIMDHDLPHHNADSVANMPNKRRQWKGNTAAMDKHIITTTLKLSITILITIMSAHAWLPTYLGSY